MGDLGVRMGQIKSDSKKWLQIMANVSQIHTAEKMIIKACCVANWVKYSDSGDINSNTVN